MCNENIVMRQPIIKDAWFLETTSERIYFSLITKINDMTLYITLHNAMGLKSFIILGFYVFSVKHRFVWFNYCCSSPVSHKWHNSAVIVGLTIS